MTPKGTIVVGTMEMNGVFSPFFSQTAYDSEIATMCSASLIKSDRNSQPEEELATFSIEEVLADDGTVAQTIYTFTLKDGVQFSDGTEVTSDDIMFSYLVVCDPTYEGRTTLRTIPIVGMDDYVNGDATEITGIEQVDSKTVRVTLEGVDPSAIWKIGGVTVAPKAYYGEGYSKGNLDGVRAKNSEPMGAGAYMFESFANNVVTLAANVNYFKGTPQTNKIKYQVMSTANKLEAVKLGDIDITDPSASPEMVKNVEDAGFDYELIDNLGYGYIGMNADRIDDINVRKGLMHLMNRKPAVEQYYGDLAQVIERPMSTVLWSYPEGAEEVYGFNPDRALEYFLEAGYTQEGGKLVKDGNQLRIEVGIPGDGVMDHPSAPVLTQMKTELEKLGGVLEIADTDSSIFFNRLDAKEWDMFVAAWGAGVDPDLYQIYHSNGPSNHYRINNAELDELIIAGRSTNVIEERKAIYADCLDIIMDEAVIMPIYQRMNMYVFNQNNIDMTSLPENMTAFYGYFAEVENFRTTAK